MQQRCLRVCLRAQRVPHTLCKQPSRQSSSLHFQQRQSRLASVRVVAASQEEEEFDIEGETMERMEKCMEAVKRSFSTVRTGRANPAMLDRIQVDYYGAPTPLKQLAGISAPESSVLVIQPYDKSSTQAIEKAIMQSDLALTPNSDGNVIRINIPQLTADRRKEMSKTVSKLGEEGKTAIRSVRRDSMKAIEKHEKSSSCSEDEAKDYEVAVQDLTDDYVKQIDKLVKSKQDELTSL
ncbi:hypothetical protein WJX72_003122 [[Myrmecia] bisecta]|uniref:Ribosome-recycling factor, chloroplastic n=1 Tax=[Myrmecia] bisecta TaxID=41462 RepID=A0AAW1QBD0_9CHLO